MFFFFLKILSSVPIFFKKKLYTSKVKRCLKQYIYIYFVTVLVKYNYYISIQKLI